MLKIKGTALLSALFIMTLIAIAATAMALRVHLDIYRTQVTINSDKGYLASQAVVFWAMDTLADKKNTFYKLYPQGQIADFPQNLKNIYPNFTLSGKIFDLQGKFNLNNLQDKKYVFKFNALLEQVLSNKNPQEREAFTNEILYWISAYTLDTGIDTELALYLKFTPPYYPSRLPFKSISELRLVEGVDAMLYNRISPYLTALPKTLPININTASKPLLFTLKPGISADEVGEIIQARKERGIVDQNALNTLLAKLNILASEVKIESEYFLVVGEVKNNDFRFMNFSILKREKDKNGKIVVYLVEEGSV